MSCLSSYYSQTLIERSYWSFDCSRLKIENLKTSFYSVEMRIVSYKRSLLIQLEKNTMSSSHCCWSC